MRICPYLWLAAVPPHRRSIGPPEPAGAAFAALPHCPARRGLTLALVELGVGGPADLEAVLLLEAVDLVEGRLRTLQDGQGLGVLLDLVHRLVPRLEDRLDLVLVARRGR